MPSRIALLVVLQVCCFNALASDNQLIQWIEPAKKQAIWLNPGLYSYHFDQEQDFNPINIGFGVEYQFSTAASFTAGFYRNSYYQHSQYIGAYWQPISIGPFKLGMVAGAFNGYDNTNNGGWFPAALPAISVEGDLFGLNLIVIPTIPNRIAGSVSLQFKVKVWD
jgi:hypothetical protein